MKFTLSWLFDHLETSASLDEICDKLNMVGLEVEEVVDVVVVGLGACLGGVHDAESAEHEALTKALIHKPEAQPTTQLGGRARPTVHTTREGLT